MREEAILELLPMTLPLPGAGPVKKIVDIAGGSVSVVSEQDKCSTFTVRMPWM
jgi:hypothetical protein